MAGCCRYVRYQKQMFLVRHSSPGLGAENNGTYCTDFERVFDTAMNARIAVILEIF